MYQKACTIHLSKQYKIPFKDGSEYGILLHTDWERFGGRTKETYEGSLTVR